MSRVFVFMFLCLAMAVTAFALPLLPPEPCVKQRIDSLSPRTIRELINKLSTKKAPVRWGRRVSQPFFSVRGRILKIGGQDIQVFEYKTTKSAASDAARIGVDGTPAETMINWIAPPHFYKSSKLIVLYLGSDLRTIERLEGVLGQQFAGR